MNHDPSMDYVTRNSKITSVVSDDDEVSCVSPFKRPIEALVEPSSRSECGFSNLTAQVEILEALFEGRNMPQL
jgi:hypothetical protein